MWCRISRGELAGVSGNGVPTTYVPSGSAVPSTAAVSDLSGSVASGPAASTSGGSQVAVAGLWVIVRV